MGLNSTGKMEHFKREGHDSGFLGIIGKLMKWIANGTKKDGACGN